MNKTFIGIDNGVTGSIGRVSRGYDSEPVYVPTPTKRDIRGGRKIDWYNLEEVIFNLLQPVRGGDVWFILERPFKNPGMFSTSIKAECAHCNTVQAIEAVTDKYGNLFSKMYITTIKPKDWQNELLGKNLTSAQLKERSKELGISLFPELKNAITKQKDADGLLIAYHAKITHDD